MPADPPSLLYTEHALTAMAEREVSPEWVRRTVAAPDLRAPNPNDPNSESFFTSRARAGRPCSASGGEHKRRPVASDYGIL